MIWQVARLGDKSSFLHKKKPRYSVRTSFPDPGQYHAGEERIRSELLAETGDS